MSKDNQYHLDRSCELCGGRFSAPKSQVKRGRGRFCSVKCRMEVSVRKRWEAHKRKFPQIFWDRVDKSGGEIACWPWLGQTMKSRGGYGRLVINGKHVGAHRIALILSKGDPDRPDLFACHTCDNPICCNPAHLWWGTNMENVQDSIIKGRNKGAPRKIDLDECLLLRDKGWSYSQLAQHFRVNQASIGKALKRHAALKARAYLKETNNAD